MARAGWHLRQHMRLMRTTNTAADAATRKAYRFALEQANAEMVERFAPLGPGNALAAVEWQKNRIRELLTGSVS